MKTLLFIKIIICAFSCGSVLYAYLEQQNDYTKLRIEVPVLTKEVKTLEEEVNRLQYEIEQFENPRHLMELAKRPEYSHLKHPTFDQILVLRKEQNLLPDERSKIGKNEASSQRVSLSRHLSKTLVGARP